MFTKFSLLTLFVFLSIGILNAQNKDEINYLFNSDHNGISVFAKTGPEFSIIKGDFAYSTGGGGALLFNQQFFIGGYGRSLAYSKRMYGVVVKNTYTGNLTTYTNLRKEFSHGGLWMGYIHNYQDMIHFGGSLRIGGGKVSLYENDFWDDDFGSIMKDNVFVINPQVEVEFNLLKWMKLNIGAGYRVTTFNDATYLTEINGVNQNVQYFKDSELSSPELSVSLIFGVFGKNIIGNKQKK